MDQPNADRKCDHGFKCVVYTSRKQAGRKFYRCPKPIDDQDRCNFFLWADEAMPSSSQNTSSQLPSTQESALSSFPTYPMTPSTPTPNEKKRGFNFIANETLDLSPSQKRTKILDARTSGYDGGQCLLSSFLKNTDSVSQCSQETFIGDNTEELDANSIEILLRSLENIPAYVKKLEIRKIAAEKSRDAKASKIAFLEAEVERLKKREKELEELVAVLESGAA